MMLQRTVIITLGLLLIMGCSPSAPTTTVDKKLKSLFDQNEQFQQLAIKKIQALEKDVKTLKSNQKKISKQIPAIVKQIKILKKALMESGKGVTPEMEAQLDAIMKELDALEQELATVKEMDSSGRIMLPETPKEPVMLIRGSDQERIYRQYGEPVQRYLVDDKHQTWLYDNGVVVFDMNGKLISKQFE